MTNLFLPLQSLKQGHWFKLICGASFQHLPAVRSLTLAYTLAGADCIDVAADPAVIVAAQAGLEAAQTLVREATERGFAYQGSLPLLMVSLNDGEDPHFRKAKFNSIQCPTDCPRPCERICPAQAIVFNSIKDEFSGVIPQKCYGCGRCLPVCPPNIIHTESYMSTTEAIAPLVMSTGIEAVEIHTQVGRLVEFQNLWQAISPWVSQLKIIAISCPDGEGLIEYLHSLYNVISPLQNILIWQTDGRPMSGDIGDGTTIAAVKLGQKVLAAKLPGYVQLAGGTNNYTVPKLRSMGLLRGRAGEAWEAGEEITPPPPQHPTSPSPQHPTPSIAGVAYGSYARVLLSSVLDQLEYEEVNQANVQTIVRLEEQPKLLWQAVELAHSLVSQLKSKRSP